MAIGIRLGQVEYWQTFRVGEESLDLRMQELGYLAKTRIVEAANRGGVAAAVREALDAAIIDWRGVKDEIGRDVPYSLSSLDRLLALHESLADDVQTHIVERNGLKPKDGPSAPLPASSESPPSATP